jgi:hypothetical protein
MSVCSMVTHIARLLLALIILMYSRGFTVNGRIMRPARANLVPAK